MTWKVTNTVKDESQITLGKTYTCEDELLVGSTVEIKKYKAQDCSPFYSNPASTRVSVAITLYSDNANCIRAARAALPAFLLPQFGTNTMRSDKTLGIHFVEITYSDVEGSSNLKFVLKFLDFIDDTCPLGTAIKQDINKLTGTTTETSDINLIHYGY